MTTTVAVDKCIGVYICFRQSCIALSNAAVQVVQVQELSTFCVPFVKLFQGKYELA